MADMFKNYPQPDDYKPDNYPKCRCPKRLEIMAGETAIHTFDVPFNVEDDCSLVEVIYKLGIKPIVVKNNMYYLDILVDEDGKSIITCKLSPEETLLFKNTTLDTHVQLKFYMNDGSIVYSEIYEVFMKDALDVNGREPVDPNSMIAGLAGYGYTED